MFVATSWNGPASDAERGPKLRLAEIRLLTCPEDTAKGSRERLPTFNLHDTGAGVGRSTTKPKPKSVLTVVFEVSTTTFTEILLPSTTDAFPGCWTHVGGVWASATGAEIKSNQDATKRRE